LQVLPRRLLVELLRIEQGFDQGTHGRERCLELVGNRGNEIILQAGELHLPAKSSRNEKSEQRHHRNHAGASHK
jgi:hypothetical protein